MAKSKTQYYNELVTALKDIEVPKEVQGAIDRVLKPKERYNLKDNIKEVNGKVYIKCSISSKWLLSDKFDKANERADTVTYKGVTYKRYSREAKKIMTDFKEEVNNKIEKAILEDDFDTIVVLRGAKPDYSSIVEDI